MFMFTSDPAVSNSFKSSMAAPSRLLSPSMYTMTVQSDWLANRGGVTTAMRKTSIRTRTFLFIIVSPLLIVSLCNARAFKCCGVSSYLIAVYAIHYSLFISVFFKPPKWKCAHVMYSRDQYLLQLEFFPILEEG